MANVLKRDRAQPPETGARPTGAREVPKEERDLVRRAQAGDEAAYEKLVETHQRRVFAVVGRILRGREDIEDIAQQVFVKAYFSLQRFDLRSTFSTWLYKITVNECWDYLRKKRVRPLVYEADLSEEQVGRLDRCNPGAGAPLDPAQRAELREFLERLLEELPEKDRVMMVLKEEEGFSVEEIGRMFDLNPNTVKVRLFRARARLMEVYRQRLRTRPRAKSAER